MDENTHGGKRPGAGRKQVGLEPRKPRTISLTDSETNKAKTIGQGNVSQGISKSLMKYDDSLSD